MRESDMQVKAFEHAMKDRRRLAGMFGNYVSYCEARDTEIDHRKAKICVQAIDQLVDRCGMEILLNTTLDVDSNQVSALIQSLVRSDRPKAIDLISMDRATASEALGIPASAMIRFTASRPTEHTAVASGPNVISLRSRNRSVNAIPFAIAQRMARYSVQSLLRHTAGKFAWAIEPGIELLESEIYNLAVANILYAVDQDQADFAVAYLMREGRTLDIDLLFDTLMDGNTVFLSTYIAHGCDIPLSEARGCLTDRLDFRGALEQIYGAGHGRLLAHDLTKLLPHVLESLNETGETPSHMRYSATRKTVQIYSNPQQRKVAR